MNPEVCRTCNGEGFRPARLVAKELRRYVDDRYVVCPGCGGEGRVVRKRSHHIYTGDEKDRGRSDRSDRPRAQAAE